MRIAPLAHPSTRRIGAAVARAVGSPRAPGRPSIRERGRVGSDMDPDAVDALLRVGCRLRSLGHFAVHGTTVHDEVIPCGQKVQVSGTMRYLVRAADGLVAEVSTDRKQRVFYYDGSSLTVHAPRMHYYATVEAPESIDAMLDQARERHGIVLPVAELLHWATTQDVVSDLDAARYVGRVRVDGTDTDHFAYRLPEVDWQLWIARGSALPRQLVVTATSEPCQPQRAATLSWALAARVDDGAFSFIPPPDTVRIRLWSAS
jgi:hypothetical protein